MLLTVRVRRQQFKFISRKNMEERCGGFVNSYKLSYFAFHKETFYLNICEYVSFFNLKYRNINKRLYNVKSLTNRKKKIYIISTYSFIYTIILLSIRLLKHLHNFNVLKFDSCDLYIFYFIVFILICSFTF